MEEIWKDIEGYEGLHQVSNVGNVRSFYSKKCFVNKESKILTPSITKFGYRQVTLSKGGKRTVKKVCRLVAESFIENKCNKPTINHINHIRTDDSVCNLEFATYKEQCDCEWKRKQSSRDMSYCKRKVKCVETNISYDSITEAGKQTGLCFKNIQAACVGKTKTCGGYHWIYT